MVAVNRIYFREEYSNKVLLFRWRIILYLNYFVCYIYSISKSYFPANSSWVLNKRFTTWGQLCGILSYFPAVLESSIFFYILLLMRPFLVNEYSISKKDFKSRWKAQSKAMNILSPEGMLKHSWLGPFDSHSILVC